MLAQGGRAGLVPGQVDGLHQGHRLGGRGHILLHHAVIGGEDQQVLLFDSVMHRACDACQLDGQLLQPSQGSGGLGQLGLPFPGFRHGSFIQGLNIQGKFHHKHLKSGHFLPAIPEKAGLLSVRR